MTLCPQQKKGRQTRYTSRPNFAFENSVVDVTVTVAVKLEATQIQSI